MFLSIITPRYTITIFISLRVLIINFNHADCKRGTALATLATDDTWSDNDVTHLPRPSGTYPAPRRVPRPSCSNHNYIEINFLMAGRPPSSSAGLRGLA
ncbi:hypothetical protein EVAR_101771_1 [Eumeta japonica]|uniref:Uncharacterized protein n=1 Tax=Eumeta variegata TaxID=151549 RepID=A0A4C1SQQ1_EUMVA|nr:hypothetical protein EVAR_101771_1 [Eumeta japonica]